MLIKYNIEAMDFAIELFIRVADVTIFRSSSASRQKPHKAQSPAQPQERTKTGKGGAFIHCGEENIL